MLELSYSYDLWKVLKDEVLMFQSEKLDEVIHWVKNSTLKVTEAKISTYLYDEQTFKNLIDSISLASETVGVNLLNDDSLKIDISIKCLEGKDLWV